jgi:hypothetical protein
VGSQEITAKGLYKVDNSTAEGEAQLNAKTWKVTLTHKLSKQDKLKAVVSSNDAAKPVLSYTRAQDGVELTLSAPVSSDISALASIKVVRTFDL